MLRLVILLCGFIGNTFQFENGKSKELQFQITRNDELVGVLTIRQYTVLEKTTYALTSDVSVGLGFTVQVSEKITDVFEAGELQTSSHQRYINDVCRAKHLVTRQDNTYQLVNQQDRTQFLTAPIQASVVSIYFHEPDKSQWVYSQNFQKMVFMEKTGPHSFRIELPNRNVSNFIYKDGVVATVVTDGFMGTIRFINNNSSSAK